MGSPEERHGDETDVKCTAQDEDELGGVRIRARRVQAPRA